MTVANWGIEKNTLVKTECQKSGDDCINCFKECTSYTTQTEIIQKGNLFSGEFIRKNLLPEMKAVGIECSEYFNTINLSKQYWIIHNEENNQAYPLAEEPCYKYDEEGRLIL